MKIRLGSLAALIALQSPFALGDDYTFEERLSLDAGALSAFSVKTGAGDLEIRGKEGIDEVSVIARVGGASVDKEDYVVTLEQDGDKARLVATFVNNGWGNQYIDVEVIAPARLNLAVDDSSGDTLVRDFNSNVSVDDTSGDLRIANISGPLKVDDTSGDLRISKINGNLKVDDNSGEIAIDTVTGNIMVEDNSGDIKVATIVGNVSIDDGSGDIEVLNVLGDVTVDDGSGDIEVDGADSFTLEDDGSGDVELSNIRDALK